RRPRERVRPRLIRSRYDRRRDRRTRSSDHRQFARPYCSHAETGGLSFMTKRKLEGAERRKKLVQLLQEATTPLPGRALGEQTGVSRQVIVGDITLLKAKGCPIIATSRGYLYIDDAKTDRARRTIACL